jgi:hypothetical protein
MQINFKQISHLNHTFLNQLYTMRTQFSKFQILIWKCLVIIQIIELILRLALWLNICKNTYCKRFLAQINVIKLKRDNFNVHNFLIFAWFYDQLHRFLETTLVILTFQQVVTFAITSHFEAFDVEIHMC